MSENDISLGMICADKESVFKKFLTRERGSVDVGDYCHQLVTYAELSRLIISCPWLEIADKRGIADILFARLNKMTGDRPEIPEPVVRTPPF